MLCKCLKCNFESERNNFDTKYFYEDENEEEIIDDTSQCPKCGEYIDIIHNDY